MHPIAAALCPIRSLAAPALLALSCLALLLPVTPALAGDFYVSGNLAISGATGDTSGQTEFFSISGSDTDSAPVYGGTIGYGFKMSEPIDRVGNYRMPSIGIRNEVAVEGGRDYEMRTRGGDGFFTKVESWSVMQNSWVDVPVHDMVSAFMGRIPILMPLQVYVGGGIGVSALDTKTTDNFTRASKEFYNFSWQVGTGLSYELTDRVTFSMGYRYVEPGDFELKLRISPDAEPFGKFKMDLEAHEFTTALRVDFYTLGMPTWR
jgi:opacity protein-like surface antigen